MAGIYSGTGDGIMGGLAVIARASGPNTGDEMIKTSDGQWWLLVNDFSFYRATGERRGVIRGQLLFEA